MRQFYLIASIVGLFMYAGFAVQDSHVAAPAPRLGAHELAALETALEAAGARTERVLLAGWAEVEGDVARTQLAEVLGWDRSLPGSGEIREAKIHRREGRHYLAFRWELSASSVRDWHHRAALVRQALGPLGETAFLTVQLEGLSDGADSGAATDAALNAVRAARRESWTGPPAASVAAQTSLLPPSPLGINIQVAARHDPLTGKTRVWAAWPALMQDY